MNFSIQTKGFNDIIDITDKVREIVKESRVKNGICLIFCPGSTGGITTIEFETGAISDLKNALEKIAPMNKDYEHNKRWGDGNGYAHVRSALLKPSMCIPVENSDLVLGTWQQIIFIDFDNKPRNRELIIKVK
ncbi:MAG: secondary thiamine-phosphate synthase enzyme YjbQ [Candidatus Aenigmarchaeota archaeon]|nr:secondary thiamine-phosphate synthase enzyme YjbQ [Candidatus Aenigmarchaeota archaeon]